jgi:hypothetical protein
MLYKMGYELFAYFTINQDEIEQFIISNNIDRNDYKQGKLIVEYYKTSNPEIKDLSIFYSWNKESKIHELNDSYKTNFIRDDDRFSNEEYHKILEEKYNRKFPYILTNINWHLHNAQDAIEIANELTIFFGEDDKNYNLMSFADWLRITSKYCDMYDLSL